MVHIGKTRPGITVDSQIWELFTRRVDNASQELEDYMRTYVDEDVPEEAEELRKEIERVKERKQEIEQKKQKLKEKEQQLEQKKTEIQAKIKQFQDKKEKPLAEVNQ